MSIASEIFNSVVSPMPQIITRTFPHSATTRDDEFIKQSFPRKDRKGYTSVWKRSVDVKAVQAAIYNQHQS